MSVEQSVQNLNNTSLDTQIFWNIALTFANFLYRFFNLLETHQRNTGLMFFSIGNHILRNLDKIGIFYQAEWDPLSQLVFPSHLNIPPLGGNKQIINIIKLSKWIITLLNGFIVSEQNKKIPVSRSVYHPSLSTFSKEFSSIMLIHYSSTYPSGKSSSYIIVSGMGFLYELP